MDSSKREAQNQLEAIKQSILDGRLTHGQICDALAEEIKKELQKNAEEVDIEYVLIDRSSSFKGSRASGEPCRAQF